MKKNISAMPIEYGRFYKANDKIARVCGTAHSIFNGEDVVLFSYVENYTTSDVYYCTKEVFMEKFTPMSKY